jgi:hypothetical protein
LKTVEDEVDEIALSHEIVALNGEDTVQDHGRETVLIDGGDQDRVNVIVNVKNGVNVRKKACLRLKKAICQVL